MKEAKERAGITDRDEIAVRIAIARDAKKNAMLSGAGPTGQYQAIDEAMTKLEQNPEILEALKKTMKGA